MHAKVQLIPSIRSRVMTGTKFGFIHTYIHTYIHTLFKNLLFWLRNLKNIEIHQNFWFENFHRYKAFSLRKQKLSPNKICLIIKYRAIANNIIALPEWKQQEIQAFIPNHLLTEQGIIKGISTDITIEESTEFTELDSLFGPLEIINFRRFTRKEFNKQTNKTEIVPTTTVQFTVRGQCLPAEVKIYKVIYPVEIYFPQIRQSYRCFKFGHIKINCKSAKELCIRCRQTNHKDGSKCPLNKSQPKCLHCQDNHLPIHKNCPARKKAGNQKYSYYTQRHSSRSEIPDK